MDAIAALLRAPDSSSARLVGTQYTHHRFYSEHDLPACDPESVHAFRGVLIGVVLGALLWVPGLWLIL